MAARGTWLAAVMAVLGSGCVQPTSGIVEPLRILNWSPAAGSTCVATDVTIFATFSSDLDPASLDDETFHLRDANGEVAATIEYDQANFTVRLRANDPLIAGQAYTVVVAAGLESKDEGRLAANVENGFLTAAASGCTHVVCHGPSDCPGQVCGNIGVCIDACVTDRDCHGGTCSNRSCNGGPPPGDPDLQGDADLSGDSASGGD
jgi:hypothetical protein